MIIMAIFSTEEEKIKALEKRLRRLERNTVSSLEIMKSVLMKMSKENQSLREHIGQLEKINSGLKANIKRMGVGDAMDSIIKPIKKDMAENTELIKEFVSEGLVGNRKERLMKFIKKSGKISVADASKKLGVYEGIVEQWGKELQKDGLIEIKRMPNKVLLVKAS
jgi:hypothetical protein